MTQITSSHLNADHVRHSIELAFSNRKLPPIGQRYGDDFHNGCYEYDTITAFVESFEKNGKKVGHRDFDTSLLHHLKAPACLYFIGYYMLSIIDNYKSDDYIIWTVTYLFASPEKGKEMRMIATPQERSAICLFLKWLASRDSTLTPDFCEESRNANKIWCHSPVPS